MASEADIAAIVDTLIAEGYAEGPEGMRLIAETILNRAEQRGISPAEVVRQRAQYTGYENPGPAAQQAHAMPAARSAAQAAWQQAQGPDDPTGGANHYFNPNVVTPSWASAMTPTGQYGNHAFYTDRPAAPPRLPPAVPPRRPDSMNGLHPFDASVNTPRPNADGSHSTEVTRTVQLPSGGNSDLQTALDRVATRERNRVVPAPAEDRVTARNRSVWQTPTDPFNGDPMTPASGSVVASFPTVPSPPTTRPVQTSTIRPSASDLVRGNPMQTKEVATTVASYPTTTRPKVSASDLARGKSGISTVATIPTTGYPTTAQIVGATGFRPPPAIPERLPQGVAGLPAIYGTGNVAGVGTNAVAPMPFNRPPSFPVTQMAQGKVAPIPFNRPTAVGTQLSTQPMPPMPIPRPPMGMGGAERPAPRPATMSPWLAFQRSLPALPTLRPPTSPAAQKVWMTGFSDSGSSGGAHGGSENDKHRGEAYQPNVRNMK